MIFVFSGTGNTLWAARQLAEATGEQLFSMADELQGTCRYQLHDGERIGFCFPVHGWQPPHLVRQFIEKMQLSCPESVEAHYCYALCTCGDSTGLTMTMLSKALRHHGLRLHSAFSLIMPESYVCLPFMYTDTQEREREKIAKAQEQLNSYMTMIADRRQGEEHLDKGATPWTFSHVIGAYFNAHMISDKKFCVDADLCIHCGRCQKVCPTHNISMAEGLPTWSHDGKSCTCCLACYHHCPQHAINYGKITRKRGQYYFGKNKQ